MPISCHFRNWQTLRLNTDHIKCDEFSIKSDNVARLRQLVLFQRNKRDGLATRSYQWRIDEQNLWRDWVCHCRTDDRCSLVIQSQTEMEPGLRVSTLGPGRVTGQSPDPAFWPGFLFNVVKNCRQLQSVSFIILMHYWGHWHVSHKTSSLNFCIKISVAR